MESWNCPKNRRGGHYSLWCVVSLGCGRNDVGFSLTTHRLCTCEVHGLQRSFKPLQPDPRAALSLASSALSKKLTIISCWLNS